MEELGASRQPGREIDTSVKRLAVLGATGSIGLNTLDVARRHPQRYQIHTVSARRNVGALADICREFEPTLAIMLEANAAEQLRQVLRNSGCQTRVEQGDEAIECAARAAEIDIVVSAIVGAAALLPTLAAASSGKRILLANKEALVMCGDLVMSEARASGAVVMPVDSEHNAIFQSLPIAESGGVCTDGVEKILLTASGGPFRNTSLEDLRVATVQQALAHPNWSMGPKISVDSATLMNKGLEVIEACRLFDISADQIEVVVHPESIIHSMVRYVDGSVLAQLGRPDMRTPIAHSLAWPERIDAGVAPLDFSQVSGLHFEKPDLERFPALRLAFEALHRGGSAPAVLNAANEVAVESFLAGDVAFLQLAEVVENTLDRVKTATDQDLATIIQADAEARAVATDELARMGVPR